eukprot:IDg18592t1
MNRHLQKASSDKPEFYRHAEASATNSFICLEASAAQIPEVPSLYHKQQMTKEEKEGDVWKSSEFEKHELKSMPRDTDTIIKSLQMQDFQRTTSASSSVISNEQGLEEIDLSTYTGAKPAGADGGDKSSYFDLEKLPTLDSIEGILDSSYESPDSRQSIETALFPIKREEEQV